MTSASFSRIISLSSPSSKGVVEAVVVAFSVLNSLNFLIRLDGFSKMYSLIGRKSFGSGEAELSFSFARSVPTLKLVNKNEGSSLLRSSDDNARVVSMSSLRDSTKRIFVGTS